MDNIENLPSKIATLVPTISDKDFAEELKRKIIEKYQPLLEILTEAKRNGFEINMQYASNGFGIVQLVNIQVMKIY